MKSQEESASSTMENVTDGVCFYAIIGVYYIPAFIYNSFKKGVNFLDQQTLHFSD
ncbi:hypothetical protein [Thalassotalea marina]|uniref:Uncharacterized protein n=1 Tax=Thalassotalea marina TaxID=1673741 RepID=A0A919BPS5_9GAMM|nr:hypothetical protein [Thalassotalea marina]GHG05127.1 hypothetical protein GCM10017161_38310 [Thalassotalea marina]